MWKLLAFIVSNLLLVAVAIPIEQDEAAKPVVVEVIDLPADSASVVEIKPTEENRPVEAAIPLAVPSTQSFEEVKPATDARPVSEAKPVGTKPIILPESGNSGSTLSPTVTTFIEALATPSTSSPSVTPPRRQVHYDQRQDGKFNIRADLDNFVILVVPSSGLSLLDLLKRSNTKPHHSSHGNKRHHTKSHKKYYSKTTTLKTNDKHYLRPETPELAARPVGGEFIEGRTPYHVDISSAEISQAAPAAAATTIADLPLSNSPTVVDATVFLPAAIKGNAYARNLQIPTLAIYPRHRKSLTNDDQTINTNSVSLTPIQNDNDNGNSNGYQHAIINGNLNDNNENNGNNGNNGYGGTDDDDIVKTVADQTEILTSPEFYSLNMASIDPLALASDTKTTTSDSRLELTLLGAQEQCGPDRRRDSYGVCQFVPQDYAT